LWRRGGLVNIDGRGRREEAKMRRGAIVGATLLAFGLCAAGASAAPLTLMSPDLAPGARVADEQVGNEFGCTGGNASPALAWTGAPSGTKSFAAGLYDPDAQKGAGFWHWMIFDIPASETGLAKNAGDPQAGLAPAGAIQAHNGADMAHYFGPCPPPGDKPHHYRFSVFALDVATLGLDASATATAVAASLKTHTLAEATLTGIWNR
jgi:Raf kinase inhibitor-like YbhB/YbcL family protein